MLKREFLKTSSATLLLASLGISLESCSEDEPQPDSTPVTIDLDNFPQVLDNDGWALDFESDTLLVNIDGEILAFSSRCPHAACTDQWSYSSQTFRCGCHGSTFNNRGALLGGPASTGLSKRAVSREGNILTIGG